jgi:hypothetical protein
MSNDEVEQAIETAINALGLAKLALSKSALPIFSQSDELRKAFLGDYPRASEGDALMKAAQDAMADLDARMGRLEAARDAKPAYSIAQGNHHGGS